MRSGSATPMPRPSSCKPCLRERRQLKTECLQCPLGVVPRPGKESRNASLPAWNRRTGGRLVPAIAHGIMPQRGPAGGEVRRPADDPAGIHGPWAGLGGGADFRSRSEGWNARPQRVRRSTEAQGALRARAAKIGWRPLAKSRNVDREDVREAGIPLHVLSGAGLGQAPQAAQVVELDVLEAGDHLELRLDGALPVEVVELAPLAVARGDPRVARAVEGEALHFERNGHRLDRALLLVHGLAIEFVEEPRLQ